MCDKGIWIKDIHPNLLFQGFFHMKHDHSQILLADASGSIHADLEDHRYLQGLSGNIIWVSGRATTSIDGDSINILSLLPTERWTGNPFALTDPKLPGFKHSSALYHHVQSIQDQDLRRLVDILFADTGLMRGFMSAPASLKHHHAFPGGLAKHTLETLDMASQICATLSKEEHALVISACLLHDAGKAFEYSCNQKYLSQRGYLLGHEITLLEWLSISN
ncbi:HD domain-containing protein [Mariprofundus sp. KV]|uniref:HD domain-containing protein n=1 Tax=Mariprofundus sp. KV TaxID=2608715 RepID=UPI0015A3B68E|nr:HD domain-containing protein [Mariprofundus sp. KV]